MDHTVRVLLLFVFNYLLAAVAETANEDYSALQGLMNGFLKKPDSWDGPDPCGGSWIGIKCNDSRITSITLPSMNLKGRLADDIGFLSELQDLDLSYNRGLTGPLPQKIGNLKKLSSLSLVGCNFTDPIPDTIGQLQQLVFLSLNSNSFSGRIPPSIGNLSNLSWLDLTDNQLEGPIPVSSGTTPGLDKLYKAQHFHLGMNKLSGQIPPQLFNSELTLIHVLLDQNQLSGNIPPTLGLVLDLEVVRFDGNSLSGSVPQSLKNLTNVQQLVLSNNKLSGPLPDLGEMKRLNYLDMSNNSFESSEFPRWFSYLENLVTLMMENTNLEGQIPDSLFNLASLQIVKLNDNKINGTLVVNGTTRGNQLRLVNLQRNSIEKFVPQDGLQNVTIILLDNHICRETGMASKPYCSTSSPAQPPSSISDIPQPSNCPEKCNEPDQIPSPKCICAYPYQGTLKSRVLLNFPDQYFAKLENGLMFSFRTYHLPVDSVSFSNPTENLFPGPLNLGLKVFPSGQEGFNHTGLSNIASLLSNLSYEFEPPELFGPLDFVAEDYGHYEENSKGRDSLSTAVIIGVAVCGSLLLVLALLAGVYAFRQKKRAERAIERTDPFRSWDTNERNSAIPQLKGARHFSFQELQKYTKNFSQDNEIGYGGYGKVYGGTLPNGQLIAIKRAQNVSLQRGLEFKAEIELLSRVHHKNLVSLVGFCFEPDEQMLVYEYVPNGTLKDSLSGKSGIRLDWTRRLKVALGAARGLAYLHELADPPIIHRDIKSNNILLDERLNAKVSDFGLSKPWADCEKDHMTTQVKGTLGYLDPEYYTSEHLTKKSDVYSFGVLMLELITARKPIERGQYIVKIVRKEIDKTKELYGLHGLVDPAIGLSLTLPSFEKFVDLTMNCLEESSTNRPTMTDVVREIESMLLQAGPNLTPESASTSVSFEDVSKGSHHPYSNESFDSSAVNSSTTIKGKC
ncbi:hypothetical protein L6164_036106 [Bauhinia variegata]|uniref:Uncharacterized protein n=1 Tax=Bauhinia variegata TaxID=167791 RepID=A0ACB9KG15_BAUVA|nr:hypothetical protein L6164_036106 [Bauhinia variegata]